MLTGEQQKIIDLFLGGNNVFMTGSGGTGKTHMIRQIRQQLKGENVQVCAMTGCASVLLGCGAQTLHSWANIGIANGENEIIATSIANCKYKSSNWSKIDILIVDEISMMSKKLFELLNLIGKKVRKNSQYFGGIHLLFSGDFYQLAPIGNTGCDNSKYCFESDIFLNVFKKQNIVQLTNSFRQSDACFFELLNQIRVGKISKHNTELLSKFTTNNTEKPKMYLFPTRKQVDEYNHSVLSQLNSPIYTHIKQIIVPKTAQCGQKILCKQEIEQEIKQIEKQFSGSNILELKVGCKVMIIVNLSTFIVNGTQGTLLRYSIDGHPVVQIGENIDVEITPYKWESPKCPQIYLRQYPLILAYAISIHRCQGMGLSEASVDIGQNVFADGQTYVGLSRLRSLAGLQLVNFDPLKITINQKVAEFYNGIN